MRFAPLSILLVTALVAVVAVVPASARARTSWRVVAGSTVVRDALGQRWTAGDGVMRGGRLVGPVGGVIGRTASPRLYRMRRDGIRSLRLPLGRPGTYGVVLRLVAGTRAARVFDVTAEGTTVADDVDPARDAGGRDNAW
ncbi:MAG TPA: hypothetical protein VNT55_24055, partial [Baekduia sp.]|nr:hypothetical protein [Baekduia sp.]